MIVDTSALIAILEDEPEAEEFQRSLMATRLAWREFGKGNHPARLNFGDCFVYALAKTLDEPLLFKGDDFTLTDIQSAS